MFDRTVARLARAVIDRAIVGRPAFVRNAAKRERYRTRRQTASSDLDRARGSARSVYLRRGGARCTHVRRETLRDKGSCHGETRPCAPFGAASGGTDRFLLPGDVPYLPSYNAQALSAS